MPDEPLQQLVERALCLWAAADLGESQWIEQIAQADDVRGTITRFAILENDPQRLALVVMLQGLRNYPEAWVCGVQNVLSLWPKARPAAQDVLRTHTGQAQPVGTFQWRL